MNILSLMLSLCSYRPCQLAVLVLFPLLACATDPPPKAPKREFRAVWVATFHNIDWPSAKGLSPAVQQQEFEDLLIRQQHNGMNALFVQVRPSGDAFYKSTLAPWSEYLSGTQGTSPGYDPLAYMVEATHQKSMEFHAWMNPFRAISHKRFSSVSSDNVALIRPEWCFEYGERVYLNPGLPEVRDYLVEVIMEVVRQYDVDGIHFDDYFYPYESDGVAFRGDLATFKAYGEGFEDIHDWRRHNLDLFIQDLSAQIEAVKPWVKFGISPVGIWRNKTDDPRGSRTSSSYTAYDMLHADVRFWLVKGWIDYVAPQLYWSTDHPFANYNDLLPWWAENSFGRHVYVGHAAFKLEQQQSRYWKNPSQLPIQLDLRRRYGSQIHGGVFYSAGSFESNPHGLEDLLRFRYHKYPSLIPAMPWKDPIPPGAPEQVSARQNLSHTLISWTPPAPAADGDTAVQYVIYKFRLDQPENISEPDHIIGTSMVPYFIDTEAAAESYYLITAMDRLHNESFPVKTMVSPHMMKSPISSDEIRFQHTSPYPGRFLSYIPFKF